MPKRANPFVEDFVQQSKVLIGMKQFNNNEEGLKKVYEKTLELLFRGAKKSAQDVANVPNVVSHDRNYKMKQLTIGKDGALLNSGIQVPAPCARQKVCGCSSAAVDSHCAYCETPLCSACQRCCARCERAHCALCSLLGSESAEVCVSCYG